MIGAIIGDIVGSRFEFNNHRSKDFDLFGDDCFVTDDSIMSLAVGKAIMEAARIIKETSRIKTEASKADADASMVTGLKACIYDGKFQTLLSNLTVKYMQEIGQKYPDCGFGGRFYQWVFSENPEPYNSFGNGAAMRVSSAGFVASCIRDAERLAEIVTEVTHNHEEGLKGARATAVAIAMARQGACKSEIRKRIVDEYYSLDFRIDDIRQTYRFNETCQETVPQAFMCFLESTSFEDAIKTAISLGGDSDTIGAITGAIAEAYYGVPASIKEKALGYLDDELLSILKDWERFNPSHCESFKVLTKFIGKFEGVKSNSMADESLQEFNVKLLQEFQLEFYEFLDAHTYFELDQYYEILGNQSLNWDNEQTILAKLESLECPESLENLDAQAVLALIMTAIVPSKASLKCLTASLKCITACLKRLKDIDWQAQDRQISKVALELGGYFGGYSTYYLISSNDGAERSRLERFAAIHTEYWNSEYIDPSVCDGEQWSLDVSYSDEYSLSYSGSNAYPENWTELLEIFNLNRSDEDEYVDEDDRYEDAHQLFTYRDLSSIDVLDESLYSYDRIVFGLTPAVQKRTSEGLVIKVKEFIDSAPAVAKAKEYVKTNIEYQPRYDLLPEEIREALRNGTAEIIPFKGSENSVFLQIRTTISGLVINGKEYHKNRKIKDIALGVNRVPADVEGAMQCLAMQNQLNQISQGLREISEACEFNFGRVIQGQRDDRLAKLLSSRSSFVQALAMSDESIQKQMLLQAIRDANAARAELAFQIKSDIFLLGGDKSPKSKDMVKMVYDINTAIVAMNNAVQLSMYSYQIMGERTAQLAVIKEHETFVKQVLLKQIEHKGNKHSAWKLICSAGNSVQTPQDFSNLPAKLLESCTAFIEGNSKSAMDLLEGI